MIHLDLFSGIGGFAYAADQVWDDVTHIFCDNDKFCREVLKKHWPESEIYDDIRDITEPSRADLLTGGFPCQPFSAAGLRRGTADERHLWPEMLRVIRLSQPTWVIAENVRGLITWNEGLVFEQVCSDLESAGYDVQPFIIPALAVNAPHRRDRIWFVANRISTRSRDNGKPSDERRESSQARPESLQPKDGRTSPDNSQSGGSHAKDPDIKRSRGGLESSGQVLGRRPAEDKDEGPDWSRNWVEVATELCSVDDGLPAELDGFKLSKSQHRKEQLKAYGNAIVPQVAIQLMRGMG